MPVLPIIDLRKARGPPRESLVQELHEALTTVGFFYLTGVEGYDYKEILELNKWFFRLPIDIRFSVTKKMFDRKSSNVYRGYFPVQPGEISHKEGFEVGLPPEKLPSDPDSKEERILAESTPWPKTGNENEDAYFKERMTFYYSLCTDAALELMSLIAEAWNLDRSAFMPWFTPYHLSTLRLLHYPPREKNPPKEAMDGDTVLLCDEHKDSTVLTLLSTFDYEGLQIRGTDGEWMDVPNLDNCMVVNIGVALSTISGGVLKATNHRVVDKGEDRFSCPFFLEPCFHANLNIRLPKRPEEALPKTQKAELEVEGAEPLEYGRYLIKSIMKYAESRFILDF